MIAQGDRAGTYLLASNLVNGHSSWSCTSQSQGIWFVPKIKKWVIGPLKSIGLDDGGIISLEIKSDAMKCPERIKYWHYHTYCADNQSNHQLNFPDIFFYVIEDI